eukprot:2634363-Pleurochrysis_carterae.AAC.1
MRVARTLSEPGCWFVICPVQARICCVVGRSQAKFVLSSELFPSQTRPPLHCGVHLAWQQQLIAPLSLSLAPFSGLLSIAARHQLAVVVHEPLDDALLTILERSL